MKSRLCAAFVFSLVLTLVAGCGHKGSQKLSSNDLKAFDSAPAEVKQVWLMAVEASKTNDYVGGQTLFHRLLNQELTPEQKDAVSKESTALNQRLYDAFDKGDAAAVKAVEELRRNPPNRQR